METKAVEEAPGVISMIRWVVRTTTYIYGFTVAVILGYWVYDAISTKDPNWLAGIGIIGAAGISKIFSEIAKVFQKKSEVKGEIEELKTIVKDVTV